MKAKFIAPLAAASVVAVALFALAKAEKEPDYPLVFKDGHEIGKDDHGRPCVLIAAALGVKAEVFREAFSGVTPAKGRGPTGEEARKNKDALMKVLKPHGVTNDRLDEVSNHYRYKPQDGELWKHTDAKGYAVVENGKVTKIVITNAGAGYSSTPKVTIKGFDKVELAAELLLDKDLTKNGSIKSIEVKK